MRAHRDLLGEHSVQVAIVVVCPVLVWLALDHGRKGILAAIGLLALVVGIYVGLRHPTWFYWGTALTLGVLPFGYFPGVHLPTYLPFVFGAVLAAVIHPTEQNKSSGLEIAVLVLVLAAAVTVVVPGPTLAGLVEFFKWSLATLFMLALVRLSPENMVRFGRIYVYAATGNGLYGLFVVVADPQQKSYRFLRIFGYGVGADPNALRYSFFNDQGVVKSLRLGGTWVEPNGAGLSMLFALAICVVVFEGWRRYTISAILVIAIALTLSRSAIATVIFGFLLVLVFHTMRTRNRLIGLALLLVIPAIALTVPTIRGRISSTLSSTDPGANDRASSLRDFPSTMAGHWLFGLGWGRPEMRQGALAAALNFVSNAPLLSVYRGGLIAGLAFVGVLVVACVLGYRALRSTSTGYAILGGLAISACLVALQLDHAVASLPQDTLAFSLFLAFLVYVDRTRDSQPRIREPAVDPSARRDSATRESRSVATLPPPAVDDAAASARY